jgi:3-deoxy-D-manno-octulosonic acid kinase
MAIQQQVGRITLTYSSSPRETSSFLCDLSKALIIPGKGRGSIRLFGSDGLKLVAREYRHGGLFRVFTGKRFLTGHRVTGEATVIQYLHRKGFPVVEPFCALVERRLFFFRLQLITVYEENRGDLLECLKGGSRKERLRLASKLAEALWLLDQAGVYHPDLHLKNVLVTPTDKLVFLDFDRARRQRVDERDIIAMFRRLARFVDKMERQGQLAATVLEKALFLRVYCRLSGRNLTASMTASAKRRATPNRIGWFIESLFYGKSGADQGAVR